MYIAATHINTDFDALASLVAATFLHPHAMGVLPGQLNPNVRDFLAVHRDILRLRSLKDIHLADVSGLIVVDTNQWRRLDRAADLKNSRLDEIVLWDHHLSGTDIEPTWKRQEECGATITLMLREMKERDCAFSPIHATLFLMGIHEDTGNLSYPSVTPMDAYMAGFLLENGADVNVAGAYLSSSFDSGHTDVLAKMIESSQTLQCGGYAVSILYLPVGSGLTMLSSVVARYRDIKGLDAAFGVFPTQGNRCMIIGCGGSKGVNIGAIMRRLGGGGHPGAGAAMVRSDDPETVYRKTREVILEEMTRPQATVADIMSKPKAWMAPTLSVAEARVLVEAHPLRIFPVLEDGVFCGIFSEAECRKAKSESQWKGPVKSIMRTRVPLIRPDQSAREALHIMAEAETGILPVLEDGRMVGVVTRGDLLLHIYDF